MAEVWGRGTCLLCTFAAGLFYKSRLEQLIRMKAKKGHGHSLQNNREKGTGGQTKLKMKVKRPLYAKGQY